MRADINMFQKYIIQMKPSGCLDCSQSCHSEMYAMRAFYQYFISHIWPILHFKEILCLTKPPSSPDGDYLLSSFTHNGLDHQYLLTPYLLPCSLSLKVYILVNMPLQSLSYREDVCMINVKLLQTG